MNRVFVMLDQRIIRHLCNFHAMRLCQKANIRRGDSMYAVFMEGLVFFRQRKFHLGESRRMLVCYLEGGPSSANDFSTHAQKGHSGCQNWLCAGCSIPSWRKGYLRAAHSQ